jgi:ABC-type multidrug transport system fused ATPase/permease subunit
MPTTAKQIKAQAIKSFFTLYCYVWIVWYIRIMAKYENLKSIKRFYKGYRWLIVLFVVFTVIAGGIALAYPFITSEILMHMTGGEHKTMVEFAVILFGLVVLNAIFYFLANRFFLKVSNRVRFDIRKEAAAQIMAMKLAAVNEKGSGFFLERLSEDTFEISMVHLEVRRAQINILLNLSFVGYITVLNPLLGLVFAAGLGVLVFLEYFRVTRAVRYMRAIKRAREKIKSNETEIIKGLKEIKGQGAKDVILAKHSVLNQEIADTRRKRNMFDYRVGGGISIVKAATDLAILLFAGLYLLPNDMGHLAAVLIVYTFKGNIYGLISSLARIRDTYVNGELSAKRLNDILNAPPQDYDRFGSLELGKPVSKIEFKKVEFSYKPDVPVLRDITFKIDRNGLYGFVGRSGSGKSTIFGLLSNFFRYDAGQVLINGIDFTDLNETAVRGAITPVLQDPYIFNDTIYNNVKFARGDATEQEIHQACITARLHDEIIAFKDGYNTMIGESGSNLSGGQKQRLEIARVVLKESSVLLMDEATSALDKTNLGHINELMKDLGKKKIVMVIAHRLGIMRQCDKVFVLDDGKIIAHGTHEELINKSEYYQELFKRQSTIQVDA